MASAQQLCQNPNGWSMPYLSGKRTSLHASAHLDHQFDCNLAGGNSSAFAGGEELVNSRLHGCQNTEDRFMNRHTFTEGQGLNDAHQYAQASASEGAINGFHHKESTDQTFVAGTTAHSASISHHQQEVQTHAWATGCLQGAVNSTQSDHHMNGKSLHNFDQGIAAAPLRAHPNGCTSDIHMALPELTRMRDSIAVCYQSCMWRQLQDILDLMFSVVMNPELLASSHIAIPVKAAVKCGQPRIEATARALLRKWSEMVDAAIKLRAQLPQLPQQTADQLKQEELPLQAERRTLARTSPFACFVLPPQQPVPVAQPPAQAASHHVMPAATLKMEPIAGNTTTTASGAVFSTLANGDMHQHTVGPTITSGAYKDLSVTKKASGCLMTSRIAQDYHHCSSDGGNKSSMSDRHTPTEHHNSNNKTSPDVHSGGVESTSSFPTCKSSPLMQALSSGMTSPLTGKIQSWNPFVPTPARVPAYLPEPHAAGLRRAVPSAGADRGNATAMDANGSGQLKNEFVARSKLVLSGPMKLRSDASGVDQDRLHRIALHHDGSRVTHYGMFTATEARQQEEGDDMLLCVTASGEIPADIMMDRPDKYVNTAAGATVETAPPKSTVDQDMRTEDCDETGGDVDDVMGEDEEAQAADKSSSGLMKLPSGVAPPVSPRAGRTKSCTLVLHRSSRRDKDKDAAGNSTAAGGDSVSAHHHHHHGDGGVSRTPVWAKEEIDIFLDVLRNFGRDYAKLMEALPHRPKEQIRNFYNNHKKKLNLEDILLAAGKTTNVVNHPGRVGGRRIPAASPSRSMKHSLEPAQGDELIAASPSKRLAVTNPVDSRTPLTKPVHGLSSGSLDQESAKVRDVEQDRVQIANYPGLVNQYGVHVGSSAPVVYPATSFSRQHAQQAAMVSPGATAEAGPSWFHSQARTSVAGGVGVAVPSNNNYSSASAFRALQGRFLNEQAGSAADMHANTMAMLTSQRSLSSPGQPHACDVHGNAVAQLQRYQEQCSETALLSDSPDHPPTAQDRNLSGSHAMYDSLTSEQMAFNMMLPGHGSVAAGVHDANLKPVLETSASHLAGSDKVMGQADYITAARMFLEPSACTAAQMNHVMYMYGRNSVNTSHDQADPLHVPDHAQALHSVRSGFGSNSGNADWLKSHDVQHDGLQHNSATQVTYEVYLSSNGSGHAVGKTASSWCASNGNACAGNATFPVTDGSAYPAAETGKLSSCDLSNWEQEVLQDFQDLTGFLEQGTTGSTPDSKHTANGSVVALVASQPPMYPDTAARGLSNPFCASLMYHTKQQQKDEPDVVLSTEGFPQAHQSASTDQVLNAAGGAGHIQQQEQGQCVSDEIEEAADIDLEVDLGLCTGVYLGSQADLQLPALDEDMQPDGFPIDAFIQQQQQQQQTGVDMRMDTVTPLGDFAAVEQVQRLTGVDSMVMWSGSCMTPNLNENAL